MKKLLYSAAIFGMMTAVFTACNKDDEKTPPSGAFNGQISATIEAGTNFNADKTFIDSVRAAYYGSSGYVTNAISVLDTATNGFSFTLAAVPSSVLHTWGFDENYKVSDTNAKVRSIDILAVPRYADFYHAKAEITADTDTRFAYRIVEAVYYYVDRDVTITGTEKGTYKDKDDDFDINWEQTWHVKLEKGWNIVYETSETTYNFSSMTATAKWTASTASVAGLKWYHEDDFDNLIWAETSSNSPAKKAIQDRMKKAKKEGRFVSPRQKR
jgi:hypothetical protein